MEVAHGQGALDLAYEGAARIRGDAVRVDLRRIGSLKEGDRVVGARIRATVVKNKVAPPFRKAEFDLMFGEGISLAGDAIDLGVDRGIVEKSGSWYSYGETRLGQGREKSREFLKSNPDILQAIVDGILEASTT